MNDRYTPDPPGTGICPHCATEVNGAPLGGDAVRIAFLHLACPQGHTWDEVRSPLTTERHWTPAPLPVGSAG